VYFVSVGLNYESVLEIIMTILQGRIVGNPIPEGRAPAPAPAPGLDSADFDSAGCDSAGCDSAGCDSALVADFLLSDDQMVRHLRDDVDAVPPLLL
jgi:hypothetical protein